MTDSKADPLQDISRCIETIESAYAFECEAGPLKNCGEWKYLKRLCAGGEPRPPAPDEPSLRNPNFVHMNMLRGGIAKPSWEQIRHLYPEEVAQPPVAAVIEDALSKKELGQRTKAELEALFGNMYSGWDRGVVVTQERFSGGETRFPERPMTPLELAARYVAAEIGANIYEIAGRAAFAPIITFSQIQAHIGPVFEAMAAERNALVKALRSALDQWNAYADIGEEGAADSRLIRTDEGDLYHECRRVLAAAGGTQNG